MKLSLYIIDGELEVLGIVLGRGTLLSITR
jgi:hypothetical protein